MLALLSVASQEQPVLRHDDLHRAPNRGQFQTTFQEHIGQIVLGQFVVSLAEVLESVGLLTPRQIWHVSNHQLITLPQQLGRPRQALRGNGRLMQILFTSFTDRQRLGQQRLYLIPVGSEQIALEAARRIDQRAENRRIAEGVVEAGHAGLEFGIVAGQRQPLLT
ncbi:MAG TPA: hypothetical protein DD418_04920, partial [Pseudomonas sp.]|nr:hypothetical protein [Pseudomonas sp.]